MQKVLLDDKLYIFILNSDCPTYNNIRVSSSIAVVAEERFLLFDIGPGTYRNPNLLQLTITLIGAVIITHFHSDHI